MKILSNGNVISHGSFHHRKYLTLIERQTRHLSSVCLNHPLRMFMFFLDKLADRVIAYQKELLRDRHPYLVLETHGLRSSWVVKRNGFGCRPVKAQAAISMIKNPPPLPGGTPPPNPSAQISAPSNKPVTLTKEAQALLNKIAAEAAAKKAQDPKPQENYPQPPPFDLLDLPDGMKAMGFKHAAYCARRWFNGRANIISDKSSEIVDQAFVDTDTFKLDWILSVGNVRNRYQHLLSTGQSSTVEGNIYNKKSHEKLVEKMRQFMLINNNFYSGTLDTLAHCGGDIQALHRQYQFQLAYVSTFDVIGISTATNDLAASLANFYLYAAIAMAEISTQQYARYGEKWYSCTNTTVRITHIYVYAKDRYSFNDDPNSGVSQYLGHWNRHGVILAWDATTSEQISKLSDYFAHESGNEPKTSLPPVPEHLDKPVDTGSDLNAKEVFYPVRNRDFNRWREIKGRGADFLIFSNLQRLRLPIPIVLNLGEVCQEIQKWN